MALPPCKVATYQRKRRKHSGYAHFQAKVELSLRTGKFVTSPHRFPFDSVRVRIQGEWKIERMSRPPCFQAIVSVRRGTSDPEKMVQSECGHTLISQEPALHL